MRKRNYAAGVMLITILLGVSSCQRDFDTISDDPLSLELHRTLAKLSPTGSSTYFQFPPAGNLDQIPQDPLNPLTESKVALGKLLFHETGLGITNKIGDCFQTYSCASCHHAGAGFQAGVAQGIGEGGMAFGRFGEARKLDPIHNTDSIDVQPIRSPTVLNGAYQKNMLWNGQFGATGMNEGTEAQWTAGTPKAVNHLGFEGLEIQAIAGMSVHRLNVDEALLDSLGYTQMFDDAFASVNANERYTRTTAGLAIAAYERTLMATEAPFQKWLRSESNLGENELRGAMLFFGKGECGSCHTGPALNSMNFHALGMEDLMSRSDVLLQSAFPLEDKGRGAFTGISSDDYKFKVPQLYNLADVNFLGHGGSFTTVQEVIEYKNKAVPERSNVSANLDPAFKPINLTAEEIGLINEFIEHSLYDPGLMRFVPQVLPSGNCFPNADTQAQVDQGCQ